MMLREGKIALDGVLSWQPSIDTCLERPHSNYKYEDPYPEPHSTILPMRETKPLDISRTKGGRHWGIEMGESLQGLSS